MIILPMLIQITIGGSKARRPVWRTSTSCLYRRMQSLALAILSFSLSPCSPAQESADGATNPLSAEVYALPKSVPDPIEPFNRLMWTFNKGLMTDVIKPTSRVYRFVVVKPVRTGIGN